MDSNTIYFSYSFVEAPAPDVTYADVELTMQLTVDSNQYSFLLNGTVYPYVSSFEIRLKSEATSDPYTIANIGGIYDPEHEFANTSSVYTTIGNFFLDALNYLGFPVSSTILTAIFGTLENAAKGTVSSSDNYKNAYFRVSFGLGDNHSFDELPNGIPAIFLLVKNAAGYTGNSRLTSHTSII